MATASEIDQLFQLPLGEFTAARNALAAKLKKSGKAADAEQVKALLKPPASAWAVNHLYWRHRKVFDRLITAGARFRQAQALQLAGRHADLRSPFEERRDAAAALARLATTALRDAGHQASPDMLRRITTTLEALATYGHDPGAPPAGRLTDDIDPPGFEALATLVPQDGGRGRGDRPPRIIPFDATHGSRGAKRSAARQEKADPEAVRQARLAQASTAVQEAERELREARHAAGQAEGVLKKAAARTKETEKARQALEARYEALAAAAKEAKQDARRLLVAAENAAQAVEDAERALEKARKELEKLT